MRRIGFLRKSAQTAALISLSYLPFSNAAVAQSAVGLKNFRQILIGYVAVTGVPANDAAVNTAYNSVLTRLPAQGEIGELSTPAVLAVGILGGTFCSRLIAIQSAIADTNARRFFKNINFALPASQVTPAVREATVIELARGFWQRDPTTSELNALLLQMNQSMVGQSDTPQVFSASLQRTCGAISASLDAITF